MTNRTVVYRIQADVGQARAQVAAFGASVKKSANDMTAATREGEKYRKGLDSLGGAAGKIGLAAAAGLGAAVAKATNFDAAMSMVQAATQETAQGMDVLREAALKAGADTAFSASEAADGIEQLAKAGVTTGDILEGGLMGALDLAAAGTIEVGDAAEIAATTMNQFGLAGEDVTHIADVLAAAAGKAQGEVTDMSNALKYVGPVASQMGVSLEETAGSIAYLASQGILGEQAGTSLRGMLTALTSPSKVAAGEMEALGLQMYDAQGKFVGLEGLAGQLQKALSGLTEAERDAALGRLFGNEQITAARILYKGGADSIKEWTAAVDDQGFAADTAAIKLDNLKGDIEALGGSLETALIGTGEGAQGPLRTLTQNLTDVVNAYNKLGDGAKSGVAITLGATALLGGGLFVFSKMTQGIANTRVALEQLGVSAKTTSRLMAGLGRAGFAVAGLAAAGAAIEALRESLEDPLPGANELAGDLLDLSDGRISKLAGEFDDLSGTISRMNPNYAYRSSDAILSLLTLGQVDGKEIDGAKQQIEALDGALANLAASGGTDVATKAFEDLAAAQHLSAAEQKALMALLPGYTDALAANENQATLTGDATSEVKTITSEMGKASYKTAEQLKVEAEALQDARDAAHETAEQFYSLTDAMEGTDKKPATLTRFIKDLENQADAMANFRENVKKAGKNGVRDGLIKELEALGPAGAKQLKWLANATEDEVARANRAWMRAQRELDRVADAILDLPKPKPIKPGVDTRPAFASFRAIDQWMDKLDGKRITTYVDVARTITGPKGGAAFSQYDTGGYTGDGGKYEPAGIVHRGEYVFDAKATKGNEAYLASLHSQLRGYAGGGLVGGSAPMAGPAIDYDRLSAAMLRARPLHGDVHVSGDPTVYNRKLQENKQRAGLGGY